MTGIGIALVPARVRSDRTREDRERMNDELIKRVASAIEHAPINGIVGNWNAEAIAAIRAVRAYDVETGPSEAEILGASDVLADCEDTRQALKAAAAERLRTAQEGDDGRDG